MATITKRTNKDNTISYKVQVRLVGHAAQVASFSKKTDAKKWAVNVESAIRENRYFSQTEANKRTLNDAIARYKQPSASIKPHLNYWSATLGNYALADITPARITEQRYILANECTIRYTTRSKATVNRYLSTLSSVFNLAIKQYYWIQNNPVSSVLKLKESRGRVRFLSDNERERLLNVCQASDNWCLYIIVMLCLSTGARKMEIMNLTWDDVDFSRNVITLHETKNGEIRLLPLVHKAKELLLAHSKIKSLESNLLFPGDNINKPIDIRYIWGTALKQAEITDFRFHDLRHSAASYLAMNRATLPEIAAVLGHKTLQTVQRYAHLSEAHTAKVVTSMNEKIF